MEVGRVWFIFLEKELHEVEANAYNEEGHQVWEHDEPDNQPDGLSYDLTDVNVDAVFGKEDYDQSYESLQSHTRSYDLPDSNDLDEHQSFMDPVLKIKVANRVKNKPAE